MDSMTHVHSLSRLPQALNATLAMQREAIGSFERLVSGEAYHDCISGEYASGLTISVSEGVGIIRVSAPLVAEWDMPFFLTGYNQIADALNAAFSDPRIESILLHLDSPGGEVAGLADFCSRFAGRNPKRVVVYGDLFASAAYTLASCVANWIVLSPTGTCGHVGVYRRVCNVSRMLDKEGIDVRYVQAGARKTDGFDDVPLTDVAIESMQADVDNAYDVICNIVARGRNMTPAAVRATEARVYVGDSAVSVGFADAIGTFADAFQAAKRSTRSKVASVAPIANDTMDAAAIESNATLSSSESIGSITTSRDSIVASLSEVRDTMDANVAIESNDSGMKTMPMSAPTVEIEIEPDMEPMPQYEPGMDLIVSDGPAKGLKVRVVAVSECAVCYSVANASGESLGDMCESMLMPLGNEAPIAPIEPEVSPEAPAPIAPAEPNEPMAPSEADDAKCKPVATDSAATTAATRLIVEAAMHADARGRAGMVAAFVSSSLSAAATVSDIESAVASLRQSDPVLFGYPAARVTISTPTREADGNSAEADANATTVASAAAVPSAPADSTESKRPVMRSLRLAAAAPRAAVVAMGAPATRETHVTTDTSVPRAGGVLRNLVSRG